MLNLEEIKKRCLEATHNQGVGGTASEIIRNDVPSLVAEVEVLQAMLKARKEKE